MGTSEICKATPLRYNRRYVFSFPQPVYALFAGWCDLVCLSLHHRGPPGNAHNRFSEPAADPVYFAYGDSLPVRLYARNTAPDANPAPHTYPDAVHLFRI